MAYNAATMTFSVGTADELNAAIANIDAIGKTTNSTLAAGAYTIQFTQNITLGTMAPAATYAAQNANGTTGGPLSINGTAVAGSSQLYALNLSTGTSVTIDGAGNTLSGNNNYNGFFVYNGQVGIQNLTIANSVAQGGNSADGGGGAGLGGGLFVAGPNATAVGAQTNTTGGNVTLTNVSFTGNRAVGGSGGIRLTGGTFRDGGGGLNGGDGGNAAASGGGGVGLSASGAPVTAGPGLILGAASGGGPNGGVNGGGGASANGGGVGGTAVSGGFGGGGGAGSVSGGFGGGGGYFGGQGGFGGGGAGGNELNLLNGGFGAGRGGGGGISAGGGGLGAGSDVFVQQGGQLTISGTSNLAVGTVTGGVAGTNGAVAGAGLGSGIFIQGNQSVTIAPGTGNTTTVSGVIADQTGSQAQLTAGQGTGTGAGNLVIGAGTTALTAANTYTGGTTIGANGSTTSSTLQLGAATSAGTGAITFASVSGNATARLGLDVAAQPVNGGTFTNRLANFGSGNELNLANLNNSSVSYNSANTSITVTGTRGDGPQVSETFVLTAPRTTSFTAVADGNGGTTIRAANPTPPPTTPRATAPAPVF